jgi:hypothetical protein
MSHSHVGRSIGGRSPGDEYEIEAADQYLEDTYDGINGHYTYPAYMPTTSSRPFSSGVQVPLGVREDPPRTRDGLPDSTGGPKGSARTVSLQKQDNDLLILSQEIVALHVSRLSLQWADDRVCQQR